MVEQEDDDARAVVLQSLIDDGMNLLFNLKFIRVEHDPAPCEDEFPTIRIVVEHKGQEKVRYHHVIMLLISTAVYYSSVYGRISPRQATRCLFLKFFKIPPARRYKFLWVGQGFHNPECTLKTSMAWRR